MSKRKNQPNRCDPRQVGLMNAAEYVVKYSIIGALKMYVEKYGEAVTEYDINAFGLDEGREGEDKITKVLNLFAGGGCYFAVQNRMCDDSIKADDGDTLRDGFEHYAFQCLYLCAGNEGEEPQLKYYAFENGGIVWDDDSEPDHDRIERLRVSEGRVMLASTMPSVSRLDRQVNAAPRHPLPHPHGRGQDVRLPRKTGTAGLIIKD